MTEPRWLLIAEFACRCRLPVSTLRYYDRVGLLQPATVDVHNGYRRYAPEQVSTAIVIAKLRAIGAPPLAISRVLAGGPDAVAALAEQRARIEAEIAERGNALAELAALDGARIGTARTADLTGDLVAVLPFRASAAELIPTVLRGIATLRGRLRRREVRPGGWGSLLPLDVGERIAGHVFARIEPGGRLDADIETRRLPSGRAVRLGPLPGTEHLAFGYDAALAAIDRLGARPGEPVIEEYEPASDPDVRFEVQLTMPVVG